MIEGVQGSDPSSLSHTQQAEFLLQFILSASQQHFSAEQDARLLSLIDTLKAVNEANQEDASQRLSSLIQAVKRFIIMMEQHNDTQLIQWFKANGVYRMVYHHPRLKAIDDQSGLKGILKAGFVGVGLSVVGCVIFALTSYFAVPFLVSALSSAIFAASMTYLSAITYGVVNDIFATRSNLPYFLLGHQPQQASLLRTNDPLAQGIAWGVAATFGPAVLASIAFGAVTFVTALFVPVATFVFPATLIAMPALAFGAEIYAKRVANKYINEGYPDFFGTRDLDEMLLGSNSYQINGLKLMSPTKAEKAAWLANSDRNMFGFTRVPFIGLGALAGIVFASSFHTFLPAVLFMPLLATALPVASASFAALALGASGVYVYKNQSTQIDNRFKLAHDESIKANSELYLEKDMHRVWPLIQLDQNPAPLLTSHQPSPSITNLYDVSKARVQVASNEEVNPGVTNDDAVKHANTL